MIWSHDLLNDLQINSRIGFGKDSCDSCAKKVLIHLDVLAPMKLPKE